jgi:hypothetical protein
MGNERGVIFLNPLYNRACFGLHGSRKRDYRRTYVQRGGFEIPAAISK